MHSLDNHSKDHPKEFDVGGKKIKVWKGKGVRFSLIPYGTKYYAEIPLENGTTKIISDSTAEGLYKQLAKKALSHHADHDHKEEHKEDHK